MTDQESIVNQEPQINQSPDWRQVRKTAVAIRLAVLDQGLPDEAFGQVWNLCCDLILLAENHGAGPLPIPSRPPEPTGAVKLTKAQRGLLQKLADGWQLKPRRFSSNYVLVSPDHEKHSNHKAEIIHKLHEMGMLKVYELTAAGRAASGVNGGEQ